MNTQQTKSQLNAAFQGVAAIAEAIRDLKSVPAGHIYANLMNLLSP